ncbi:FeoA family protein [Alienimonas californiensis]|uniref:FeoA domain protein n=1 Tax=Alienimonas californiensis TaxID=2527989 RepID=A0A517P3W2_9PLAN|nr:FeoA family protein [Alienimonas californiensis]QDT14061.1 FeoA domain protein [Alienimonas californiensis]
MPLAPVSAPGDSDHVPCPTAQALADGTLIPLDLLRTGESGTVAEILGDAPAVHRLEELGLRIGAAVSVLREGPPALLALGSQRFCFRPDSGTMVLVALAPA